MYNAIHYIIPALLLCGAIWLIHKEYLIYRFVRPKPWLLLLRRFVGALTLIAIASMLCFGDTTLILMDHSDAAAIARDNRDYATACLNYWFTLMGIVLCTIVLAIWDAIDVLRRLRNVVDASAQEDMQAFRRLLEKSERSRAKVKPDKSGKSGNSGKPGETAESAKTATPNKPTESNTSDVTDKNDASVQTASMESDNKGPAYPTSTVSPQPAVSAGTEGIEKDSKTTA